MGNLLRFTPDAAKSIFIIKSLALLSVASFLVGWLFYGLGRKLRSSKRAECQLSLN
jgi:hypothetical protein